MRSNSLSSVAFAEARRVHVGHQRRLADKRAGLDPPFGVVDGERQLARQDEIGRIGRLAGVEQGFAGLQRPLVAGEGDQLHRLARQQVEGAGARHAPDVGFEAHWRKAPRRTVHDNSL